MQRQGYAYQTSRNGSERGPTGLPSTLAFAWMNKDPLPSRDASLLVFSH